ncbi:nucleotidyltransferase family protein [Microbacterium suaedae]|uniref:nucleotidyltransferase family protein n=1 Tax=Microbacterium suaedae TaxID=2067813 RepID=UPI000DA1C37D|nr:nucleotidyltransferase domain-containing protein [Microbacterium suaedae]
MSPDLELDLDAIARVCERFSVERLRVFGSALTERFDPERSDVDLLVDFRKDVERTFRDYFALKDALEEVIGYPVDLVQPRNVRNPYIAKTVFSDTYELYAA